MIVDPPGTVEDFEPYLSGENKIVVQASDKRILLEAGLLAFSPIFREYTGFFQKIPAYFYCSESLILIEKFYEIYDYETERINEDAEYFDLETDPNLFSEALKEEHFKIFKKIMISETKFNLEKVKNVLTCAVTLGFNHFSRILFRAQLYSSFHELDPQQIAIYKKIFDIKSEVDEKKLRFLIKNTVIRKPIWFIDKFYGEV